MRSVQLDSPVTIAERIPEDPSALWLHGSGGLIGIGEAARLEATGADRFDALARAFRAVSDNAEVEDLANLRGSGLVAFAS
ncbi:MAG: isochorismate synthase, partial [Dermabacter sp.]|nr:isochorismate synthase [Dermabacter sp.]